MSTPAATLVLTTVSQLLHTATPGMQHVPVVAEAEHPGTNYQLPSLTACAPALRWEGGEQSTCILYYLINPHLVAIRSWGLLLSHPTHLTAYFRWVVARRIHKQALILCIHSCFAAVLCREKMQLNQPQQQAGGVLQASAATFSTNKQLWRAAYPSYQQYYCMQPRMYHCFACKPPQCTWCQPLMGSSTHEAAAACKP